MQFRELIGTRRLFFDGAMGTMLQAAGMPEGTVPELFGFENPDVVKGIHAAYLSAGCNILKTNTFGANRLKLAPVGLTVEGTVKAAVKCARSAGNGEFFVALDIGPTGKLLEPLGELSFDEAYDLFAEQIRAGVDAGADLILAETFSLPYEAKALILAAKENSDLPLFLSVTCDEKGRMLTGLPVEAMGALAEAMGVDAFGLNCSVGPRDMAAAAEKIAAATRVPLFFNPNAGLPKMNDDGVATYDLLPDGYADEVVGLGAFAPILGGCCGTTPEHLAAVVARCAKLPLPKKREPIACLLSSGSRAVDLSERPIIIGERINPTGKPKLKEALRADDLEYLVGEGVRQEDEGADVLDVNVGLPGIDEPAMMVKAVKELQRSVSLPLQIDSADPKALEAALRRVNGRPLLNSVSGKAEVMKAVFPIAKKYGAALVALTLDDNGIPDTAAGRIAVADRILAEAKRYGIPARDLLFDPLTMAVSAGADPRATLDALKTLADRGLKTVLGVSNISFGLPEREHINTAFLSAAIGAGLSAAILNPHSTPMTDAFRSSLALFGGDPHCLSYIEHFGAKKEQTPVTKAESGTTLTDAVLHGMKSSAGTLAREAIEGGADPMDLIEKTLIPALDRVGVLFESGTVFLPQLLLSADAAEAAFAVVREALSKRSGERSARGSIVLATVKGDIHDIGKNIVRVMLDSYGFRVFDLGRDVPAEEVLAAVKRENVTLVGLSALMTTTVPSMRDTIALLRREVPGCKVMVGGAVLTESCAREIGADRYCPDAMASVRYAEEVFS
ncbi:MAG: homocysteine S-methyltransferase family protein [Clostridia bacterium]|nr:homocysteine S-methyltransferase family protein [Clostridia bacterium]